MNDDTFELVGIAAGLVALVAIVFGVYEWDAHRPCSDFQNTTIQYTPVRCLDSLPHVRQ